MKKTVKKTGIIAILAITIMVMAAGCGKKEPKIATPVPTNEYYAFKRITNVDKDIYFVTEKGFELTKNQYDELFNFYSRSDIYEMDQLLFDNEFSSPVIGAFRYKEELKYHVGPSNFNRFWSIVKVKEETYKNTEEKNEELDRDGAAELALNEIDYEPIAIRTAHDSYDNMWRVSLFSKDDGEQVVYTDVYMTEKGKTVLITRVSGDAQYLGIW